jgi:hypothetical protein
MKLYSAIGGRARYGDIVALRAEPVVSSRSNPNRPSVRGARQGSSLLLFLILATYYVEKAEFVPGVVLRPMAGSGLCKSRYFSLALRYRKEIVDKVIASKSTRYNFAVSDQFPLPPHVFAHIRERNQLILPCNNAVYLVMALLL